MRFLAAVLSIILSLACLPVWATQYYIAASGGSDGNPGTSAGSPWATYQHAATIVGPGDTLNFLAGTYNLTVHWATSGTANAYITIACAANFGTKFVPPTADGFSAEANYLQVGLPGQGCDLTSGSGATQDGVAIQVGQHHIVISSNLIHGATCSGIGGVNVDYVTVTGNIVFGNAFTAPNNCSGISFFKPIAVDFLAGYHFYIAGNVVYYNRACTPAVCTGGATTDGNGIIVDAFNGYNGSSSSPQAPFFGGVLVENNIVFNNGGRGIHAFYSTNVYVRNNTTWGNCWDTGVANCAELSDSHGSNNLWYNNIAQATAATAPACYVNAPGPGPAIYDWNVCYGVAGNNTSSNGATYTFGAHNIYADPLLTAPIAPTTQITAAAAVAAFTPAGGSPTLKAAYRLFAPVGDFSSATARPLSSSTPAASDVDAGAIQVSAP